MLLPAADGRLPHARCVAAGLALALLLSSAGGALAQEADVALVVAEPQAGTVSIVSGNDIVDVATGLVRPVVVAADPGSDRIVIGQAGPIDGAASIISVTPGGGRSAVAWGLPGIADVLVLADGRVAYVTGVNGDVAVVADGQRPAPLVSIDGRAIGLALLDAGRLLVVTASGLGTLVAVETGEVLGVLPTSAEAPGRPATLAEPSVVCVPDAIRAEVNCAPLADGAGFLISDLAGVRAIAPAGPSLLLAVQPDLISLVHVPGGEVRQRWAIPAVDIDVLPPTTAWLGTAATSAPAPPAEAQSPAQVQLWLLVLGVLAGLGAVAVTLIVRRDATPDTESG